MIRLKVLRINRPMSLMANNDGWVHHIDVDSVTLKALRLAFGADSIRSLEERLIGFFERTDKQLIDDNILDFSYNNMKFKGPVDLEGPARNNENIYLASVYLI